MPTGGGKSLCYQLPALLLPGLTLVVSPLIALMKDQVDALTQRGIRATLLNSTLDPAEQRARILEIEAGRYDLVYVAPERFRSPRFVEAMARVRPALLAVDEAHCISEWGHDFRPDYARIGHARRQLGLPAVHRADGHRHRPGPPRHRRPARPPRPGAVRHRVRPPEPALRRRRGPPRRRQARRPGRGPRPQPRPGDHLRLEPGAMRVGRPVPRARAAPVGGRLPRGAHPRGAHRRAGAVHERARPRSSSPPTPSAWGSTRPTSAR